MLLVVRGVDVHVHESETICSKCSANTFLLPSRGCAEQSLHSRALPRIAARTKLVSNKTLTWICFFHMDMRIRFTCSALPPWASQDTPGQIAGIHLHPAEPCLTSKNQTVQAGIVLLQYLPLAIYVKIDKCDIEFLPPRSCHAHVLVGADLECAQCRFFPGVVRVKPEKVTWHFNSKTVDFKTTVQRTQVPLVYEKACPLYSLQGETTDPGLVAHFEMPARTSSDIRFLIVYVMLSRVRSLAKLRTLGLDEKIIAIIEAGPPTDLIGTSNQLLEQKILKTKDKTKSARELLCWPSQPK